MNEVIARRTPARIAATAQMQIKIELLMVTDFRHSVTHATVYVAIHPDGTRLRDVHGCLQV